MNGAYRESSPPGLLESLLKPEFKTMERIPCDLALKIARIDAEKHGISLSGFRFSVVPKDDIWQVECASHDTHRAPMQYFINASNGRILSTSEASLS